MRVASMGLGQVVEIPEPDREQEARKIDKGFRVQPIVAQHTAAEDAQVQSDGSQQAQSSLIDFVAKARRRQAKLQGKKRVRAIRSYEAIANFEDSFVYAGRFRRRA